MIAAFLAEHTSDLCLLAGAALVGWLLLAEVGSVRLFRAYRVLVLSVLLLLFLGLAVHGAPAPLERAAEPPRPVTAADVCAARSFRLGWTNHRAAFHAHGHCWFEVPGARSRSVGFWALEGGTLRVWHWPSDPQLNPVEACEPGEPTEIEVRLCRDGKGLMGTAKHGLEVRLGPEPCP